MLRIYETESDGDCKMTSHLSRKFSSNITIIVTVAGYNFALLIIKIEIRKKNNVFLYIFSSLCEGKREILAEMN